MAHLLAMNEADRSIWKELPNFDATKANVEDLIGLFEIAELLSGDVLCIPIKPQEDKDSEINSIATSLLNQKVWGECIQLSLKEAKQLQRRTRR